MSEHVGPALVAVPSRKDQSKIMPLPERKTGRLRWGRISIPGATYFVTGSISGNARAFSDRSTSEQGMDALQSIHDARDARIIAATLMPDHVHLLFTLGERLLLGQVIGKFKALTRKGHEEQWRWQNDGFEHRLRADDPIEDYGFYIFMNPYRENLISLRERWPWWMCPDPLRFLFLSHPAGAGPVPEEWIGRSQEIVSRIAVRS